LLIQVFCQQKRGRTFRAKCPRGLLHQTSPARILRRDMNMRAPHTTPLRAGRPLCNPNFKPPTPRLQQHQPSKHRRKRTCSLCWQGARLRPPSSPPPSSLCARSPLTKEKMEMGVVCAVVLRFAFPLHKALEMLQGLRSLAFCTSYLTRTRRRRQKTSRAAKNRRASTSTN
jgi:hypothetical protein